MNEEEKEIIREVKDKLEDKKHLTPYEKGQLDLIKRLRKKKPKTRLERALEIAVYVVMAIAVLTVISGAVILGPRAVRESSVEKAVRNWDGYDKEVNNICRIVMVDEQKALVCINVNCEWTWDPCDGEFMVDVNKIGGRWVVDPTSKRWLWQRQ